MSDDKAVADAELAAEAIFSDSAYWRKVREAARRAAWQGYEKKRLLDLPLRLRIIRTFLGISDDAWSSKALAHAMFGGSATVAAITFTKFKSGTNKLDETEASLLACLINCFILDPPEIGKAQQKHAYPLLAERLQISEWILDRVETPNRMTALDLTGDLFLFVRKLHCLIAMQAAVDGAAVDTATEATVHDMLMRALMSPLELANWDHRLVIQHPRQRHAGRDRPRFGAEQRVGTDPSSWEPLDLQIGKPIEYGLPLAPREPLKGWLVTIRDPWPVIDGQRATSGRYIWNVGWENIIRWVASPFPLEMDQQMVAPTNDQNELMDIPGLYRVFMLTEPIGSTYISDILERQHSQSVPDEKDYFRLVANLDAIRASTDIDIYTGSYLVHQT